MLCDSFMCVTWLIDTFDMTSPYACHVSCIFVSWLIHAGAMSHSMVWRVSSMCVTYVTCLIQVDAHHTTHPCMCLDSSMYVSGFMHSQLHLIERDCFNYIISQNYDVGVHLKRHTSLLIHVCHDSHIWMSHLTHMNRESLSWIRMTRTAWQDATRSGKEDAGHSLFLGGCLFGFYGEHNSKIRKGSCRDVTWRGLVVTWRLIRDWSYLLTFRRCLHPCPTDMRAEDPDFTQ